MDSVVGNARGAHHLANGKVASATATLLGLLFWTADTYATSYVPIDDAALAAGAEAGAEVRVLAVESAPDEAATAYLVEVERVVFGDLSGGTVEVRVPGGPAPEGGFFRVFGAPAFAPGDRALLLLDARDDGSYALSQLLLGAFHRLEIGGRQILVRDLRDAQALETADRRVAARRGGSAAVARAALERPRDRAAFVEWLERNAAGDAGAPDYFVDVATDELDRRLAARRARSGLPARSSSDATMLLGDDGLPIRWFDFDAGGVVELFVRSVPQHGWRDGPSHLEDALSAWSDVETATVSLALTGETTEHGGMRSPDGVNTVLWNDPNDEIPGAFSCAEGGLLAIGGAWYRWETRPHRGASFHPIYEADVVIQDGADCYLADHGGADGAELLVHELGHALGLDHSCGGPSQPSCSDPRLGASVMRPVLHGGGRGPVLAEDDVSGLLMLYGESLPLANVGVFVPEGDFVLVDAGGATIALAYGMPGDLPVAGDWDGDGGDTVGVFRDGRFLLHVPDGLADIAVPFGSAGDLPVAGDWDGDGIDTVGTFRDGRFALLDSHDGGAADVIQLGGPGDLPVAGDWDGDGRDELGVLQPAAGRFLLLESLSEGASTVEISFGASGDLPLAGDWNDDGVDELGVLRDGVLVLLSSAGDTVRSPAPAPVGIPVAGRWERMR